MPPRNIIITGATGKQGGAVLEHLLSAQGSSTTPSPFSYLAVTRNLASPSARRLASNANVSLLEGGFADAGKIFQQVKGPTWGAFLVTMPGKNEEAEGKAMVDEAIKANVRHFVFASVERNDNTTPTNVPHFASKHGIEQYLMARAKETGMTWTILRSVVFMENYTNDFIGKGFAAMYRQLGDRPLQLVASSDIGYWGAKAFLEADAWGRNRAVTIAGDELSYTDFARIFQEKTGRPIPVTYGFLGSTIKFMVNDLGKMFKWFEGPGFGADVPAIRRERPEMMRWGEWLERESQFKNEIAKHAGKA